MKIALDAQLTVGTATGIGEYERGLAHALRTQTDIDVVELCEPALDPWRFDRRIFWDQVVLPQQARVSGSEVLHCTAGTMPLLRPKAAGTSQPVPIVVTVHDVAWLRVQSHAKCYARWYFGSFALARYREANRIVVDSQFSRNELLEVFENDNHAGRVPTIEVVYPGVAEDFCNIVRTEGNSQSRPVILVPGTVERRKNLELLVQILPSLSNAKIVSVGPFTPYADECRALAEQLGVADRLELRGYVSRDELLHLYAICTVVAVPSTYEGFGYASAQALCAGVPVIVSDRSSLPEIACGDAPVVAIDDRSAWIAAVRDALDEKLNARATEARSRSIQRFAWRTAAGRMREIYRAALDENF